MSSHNHNYRDPFFDAEQTAGYSLLVQVGASSFSYAVVGENKLLLLEDNVSLGELANTTDDHTFLSAHYKKRIISLPQSGFTFVPVSLFREDLAADFARFLDVQENERVFSQPLDADNQVVFKADKVIVDAIKAKFYADDIVFAAKGWIKATAALKPSSPDVYLNINNDQVELLNFHDNKLRFYNVFEFKNPDELVYFTMFVVEELELHPQNAVLHIGGDINSNDENFNRLARFFNKVELNGLETTDLPAYIPAHQVLNLTALALCGSSGAY
jgi:Protein of unknown function (DUF3822)